MPLKLLCIGRFLSGSQCELAVCPTRWAFDLLQDSRRRDRLQAQTDQHARLVQDRDRAVRKTGADLGIPITGANVPRVVTLKHELCNRLLLLLKL